MKKHVFLTILLFLALSPATEARNPCRFHIVLDYHYNLGLHERCFGQSLTPGNGYRMRGNSLHLTALYDVTALVSVGAGIGADRYEEPGYNTLPLFGTLRYRPIRKFLDTYLYTDLGYGLGKRENSIYPGWMWNLGIGYTKMFRRHFGLNLQCGYNFKTFNIQTCHTAKSNIRHSLAFGIGLVF